MNLFLHFHFFLILILLTIVRTKENADIIKQQQQQQHQQKQQNNSLDLNQTQFTEYKILTNINNQSGYLKEENLPHPLKILKGNYDDSSPEDIEDNDKQANSPRKFQTRPEVNFVQRSSSMNAALQIAAKEGLEAMIMLYEKTEPELLRKGHFLDPSHPAAMLSKFSAPIEGTENNAKAAFATLVATKNFQTSYKHQSSDLGRQAPPPKISFRRTPLEGLCPPRDHPRCLPAAQRYRTHDGTCNNPKRPRWGSAQMPFNRFLPPDYADGIETIRTSIDGEPLPSARFVSLLVHGAKNGDAPVTLMIAQWGQFLDHDLTSTSQPRSINGSVPRCCGPDDFHPSCLPIKVPFDDPWLAPLKLRCLEFLRSAPAQRRDCILSWREQTNQATSFLDASTVYSSNPRTSDNARVFRKGLLLFGRGNPSDDVCLRGAIGIGTQCIRAGDGRSGEQPGLLAMHHVWVGEHNRIAFDLSNLNPHWTDEKTYQETRRIIGAMFQHITYREFLPLVLGQEVCKLFEIDLLESGYYTGYDPNLNPSVANSFAAAAFRFGHSLVQGSYMRCDRNHNFIDNNVTLHDEFSRGDLGTPGSLHRLIRGMAAQRAQPRDEFITAELTNHLFQSGGFPFGLDLAAINIQRGRDHGIPPYTAWREPCGLNPINNWEDLATVVGPGSAKRISHAYRSVHDIDLFVGGIAERPVISGLVGPTFACIIAQQFSNLRKGDRFWYENSGFQSSFTPAQLHSIRRVSLSQVVCRSISGGTLQPYIFVPHEAPGNQRIPCGIGLLQPINLLPWLEEDPLLEKQSPISGDSQLSNKATNNITSINRVDFTPNGSTGIHRPEQRNITNLNDKIDLELHLKPTTTNKSTRITTQRINDKLDNKKRKVVSFKTVPTIPPTGVKHTTRRTVIINNIPLLLRRRANEKTKLLLQTQIQNLDLTENKKNPSVEGRASITLKTEQYSNGTEHNTGNKIEKIHYNEQSFGYGTKQRQRTQTDVDLTEQKKKSSIEGREAITLKIDQNLNEMENNNSTEKKIEQITYNERPSTYATKERPQTRIQNVYLTKDKKTPSVEGRVAITLKTDQNLNGTETSNSTVNKIEERHYNEQLSGYRPKQKHDNYVIGAPDADEYEIEINIRPANNKRPILQEHSYDLTSKYDAGSTPFSYRPITQRPYYDQLPHYGPITQPPKVIYLNEPEDHYGANLLTTTTPRPGLLQSFFMIGSNSIFDRFQRPYSGSGSASSSSAASAASGGSSSSSASASSSHGNSIGVGVSASSGGFGGVVSASSSSSSTSNISFRPSSPSSQNLGLTITSQSSRPFSTYSSGRPPPSVYSNTQQIPISSSVSNPFSNSHYISTHVSATPSSYYSSNSNSDYHHLPTTRRPYYGHTSSYYPRNKELTDSDAPQMKDIQPKTMANDSIDYDFSTFIPILSDKETDDDDYYDEKFETIYDKDGYLRPEHMTLNILNNRNEDIDNNLNATSKISSDDFVLPILTETNSTITKQTDINTTFTDAIPRRQVTDILADDYEDIVSPVSAHQPIKFERDKETITLVAFSPLNILHHPERDNNWVMYDAPKENKPYPNIPELSTENPTSLEFPKPMKMLVPSVRKRQPVDNGGVRNTHRNNTNLPNRNAG